MMQGDNVEVVIVGASCVSRLAASATPAEINGELLINDEEHARAIKKIIVGLPVVDMSAATACVPLEVDNSFRGGSRGKGGKVKWERK